MKTLFFISIGFFNKPIRDSYLKISSFEDLPELLCNRTPLKVENATYLKKHFLQKISGEISTYKRLH